MAGCTAFAFEEEVSRRASIRSDMALLQPICASSADSARLSTFFHLTRMLPVFCSNDFMVARNNGPSSVWLKSSPGLEQLTSTLIVLLVRVVVWLGISPRPYSGMESTVGDFGGIV